MLDQIHRYITEVSSRCLSLIKRFRCYLTRLRVLRNHEASVTYMFEKSKVLQPFDRILIIVGFLLICPYHKREYLLIRCPSLFLMPELCF